MRLFFGTPLLLLLISGISCQDENAEDVFEVAFSDDNERDIAMAGDTMEMNEGSDTFEVSTSMLEAFTEPSTNNNTQAELSFNNSTELIDEMNPEDPFENKMSMSMETPEENVKTNTSKPLDSVVSIMDKIPQASVSLASPNNTDPMLEHRVLKEKEEAKPEPKIPEPLPEMPKEVDHKDHTDMSTPMVSSENNTEAIISLDAENEGKPDIFCFLMAK